MINFVALPIHWEPNGHKCERSILHLKYQTVGLRRRVGTTSTPFFSVLSFPTHLSLLPTLCRILPAASTPPTNPCKPPLSNQSIRAYRTPPSPLTVRNHSGCSILHLDHSKSPPFCLLQKQLLAHSFPFLGCPSFRNSPSLSCSPNRTLAPPSGVTRVRREDYIDTFLP